MRFLVDECTGPAVSSWLRSLNHDVLCVFTECRGISDDKIMRMCLDQERILITNDKDFGEKVFREGIIPQGVILLRLDDETPSAKILVLSKLLQSHAERLKDSFVVATDTQIRVVHHKKTW